MNLKANSSGGDYGTIFELLHFLTQEKCRSKWQHSEISKEFFLLIPDELRVRHSECCRKTAIRKFQRCIGRKFKGIARRARAAPQVDVALGRDVHYRLGQTVHLSQTATNPYRAAWAPQPLSDHDLYRSTSSPLAFLTLPADFGCTLDAVAKSATLISGG